MDISIRDPRHGSLYLDLKKIGFHGIDFGFPAWNQRESILSEEFEHAVMEKHRQLVAAGLKVCQTHLTYYPSHLPPLGGSYQAYEEYMLPIFEREIELISKMNCKIAVTHLYFEDSKEKSRASNIRLIEKLLPILKEKNVILSIENIYAAEYGDAHLSTAEDLLFYTDHFQSDYLGICLDTGHAVTRKQDPIEMATKIGKDLKALHLHSNVSRKDLHLPPLFVPNVDWERFCTVLKEINYAGAFNMEISAPRQMNQRTALLYYEMTYEIANGLIRSRDAERD